ncbi:MAG: hypothetical protein GY754_45215 [bacterium]|nr:hypothetical protein [bacterium]
MPVNTVVIITGWKTSLGTGHVQRMANLMRFLNDRSSMKAYIVSSETIPFLSSRYQQFVVPSLSNIFSAGTNSGSTLIIRDKRDSQIDEIEHLGKSGPVLVIDDNGPGRAGAHYRLDLLPNPAETAPADDYRKDLFLYGYNFTESIKNMPKQPIEKDIDAAFYPGFHKSEEYIEQIISLLPSAASIAVLRGKKSFMIQKGRRAPLQDRSYGEIVLASKIIISHFGITLYEGHIAGAKPVSINPTKYHSRLSDMAAQDMNIINLGTDTSLDSAGARDILAKTMGNSKTGTVSPAEVYTRIEKGLESFLEYLNSLVV